MHTTVMGSPSVQSVPDRAPLTFAPQLPSALSAMLASVAVDVLSHGPPV